MHQSYIEAAEEEANKQRVTSHPVIAAAYDDDSEDGAEDHGEEVATIEPAPVSTPGARPITEAQTARILVLADRKELIGMKDMIHEKLRATAWNEATAESYIAVLETTINGPLAADSTGQTDLGLGGNRKPASPQEHGH